MRRTVQPGAWSARTPPRSLVLHIPLTSTARPRFLPFTCYYSKGPRPGRQHRTLDPLQSAIITPVRSSGASCQLPAQHKKGSLSSPLSANPPASTRPPPLNLPTLDDKQSTFSRIFYTGKAYLAFYKAGLKAVATNYKLRRNKQVPTGTRAHMLFEARVRHDQVRMPIFALILLVCGEFTPLVVLAVPKLVPYTCRIPKQVEKLQRQAEQRTASSFDSLDNDEKKDRRAVVWYPHLARRLGVLSTWFDWINAAPGAKEKVQRRLKSLTKDDALLLDAGGVPALEDDEVKLACADRSLRVLHKPHEDLRDMLQRWLKLVAKHGDGEDASVRRMEKILMLKEDEWPASWKEMNVTARPKADRIG